MGLSVPHNTVRAFRFAFSRWTHLIVQAICGLLLFPAFSSTPASAAHLLNFPEDRSVGVVYVRTAGGTVAQAWENGGSARGEISVGDGKEVRLSLQNPGRQTLVSLRALPLEILSELSITGDEFKDPQIDHLTALIQLRRLDLGGTKVTGSGLAALRNLRNLEGLDLSDSLLDDAGLEGVVANAGLRELSLSRTRVTPAGLARLSKLKNLGRLEVQGLTISPAAFDALAGLGSLESLSITLAAPAGEAPASSGPPREIANLKTLRLLEVEGGRVDDSALEAVANLGGLQELRIGPGNAVTDKGMVHLKKLGKLRSLSIVSMGEKGGVSDSGLVHLGALGGLETLELRCSQVTDEGLASLAKLKNLRELNLRGTQINDAGVSSVIAVRSRSQLGEWWGRYSASGMTNLKKLTQLERLIIPQQVSLPGLRELEKALPGCTIVRR